jgi:hypothetical protein
MFYQGSGFPDIRTAPFNKDNFLPGVQPGFLNITDCYAVDNIPQKASTTSLAALQITTTATNLTLVTIQAAGAVAGVPSVAVGVPIVPVGTTVVQSVMALDFGFTTGTTVAASSTVVTFDNTQFQPGQWIVIGGTGNSGATVSQITQVITVNANGTGITISPAAVTAIANAPIGQANQFAGPYIPPATQFGPGGPTATGHMPFVVAGVSRVLNPKESISRNIQVSFQTTTATTTLLVSGYDVWQRPMTERITIPSGNRSATSFFGSKAFKYISSIANQTTAAGSASIGMGDVFGLPFRADYFSQLEVWYNDSNVSFNNGGFLAAFTTAPATATTGDVRGTLQMSTNGTGSLALTVQTAAVTNNTSRLTVIQGIGVWNTLNANPNNTVPMFGIAQSTT